MMKFKIPTFGLGLLCLQFSTAQAQVTLDISKITCEQFRGYTITDPNNIALWLSGYYNGRRGNTIVNVQSFKENVEKLKDICITNPKATLMQVIGSVIDKDKKK